MSGRIASDGKSTRRKPNAGEFLTSVQSSRRDRLAQVRECQRGPLHGQMLKVDSNQQFMSPTLPFPQITSGNRPDSGVRKRPAAFNLLKRNGAGDGVRTRNVQLGNLRVD